MQEQRDPSLVDRILESIDLESQKLRGSSINVGLMPYFYSRAICFVRFQDSDSVLIALYRSKLTEVIEEMVEANEVGFNENLLCRSHFLATCLKPTF